MFATWAWTGYSAILLGIAFSDFLAALDDWRWLQRRIANYAPADQRYYEIVAWSIIWSEGAVLLISVALLASGIADIFHPQNLLHFLWPFLAPSSAVLLVSSVLNRRARAQLRRR